MYLKWETVGEREKGMGRKRGEGSVHKQPGTGVDGNRTTHKGGIPRKYKRGSGAGKGYSRLKGIIKGIVLCTYNIMPNLYISCQLCVCRANKELCLGYK